jgi:hypothetical protein
MRLQFREAIGEFLHGNQHCPCDPCGGVLFGRAAVQEEYARRRRIAEDPGGV